MNLIARVFMALVATTALLASDRLSAQEGGRSPGETAESSGIQQKRKIALVIGNAAYRSLVELKNPRNDAGDICSVLKSIGFEATCIFDVATRRELREAIRLFADEARGGAETFFFYAGHGIQSKNENYLIPTDAQIWSEADIDFEGVGLSYLMFSLEQARSYPNVIVLDACRDNPFGKSKGFRVDKGLARVEPPVGTVLAYATSPNKAALDGAGRNGLFTKHLVPRLAEAGLQLDEMFRQVSKGVEDEARSVYGIEQVPYRSSSYSAAYCLAGCDDPKLIDRVKAIEAQRNELNRKLEQVSEENAKLRAQAQSGANEIAKLESRISRLVDDQKATGLQGVDAGRELERARAELESVRAEQARRDAMEKESQRRMGDLERLRAELQRQAVEIDEYRQRIRDLESARARSVKPDESQDQSRERPKRQGVIVPSF